MSHQPRNDLDTLRAAMPRRRVFQSLAGATLVLVGLAGCGGEDDEDDEDAEEQEQDEAGDDD